MTIVIFIVIVLRGSVVV